MSQQTLPNPFQQSGNQVAPGVRSSAIAASDQERAIQEVQASMVIAKKFPRDPVEAMNRILQSCTRISLAESAVYAYPKGKKTITGPSIRLAEAVAQEWGNIQHGIRELSQENGTSAVEAFAWDMQTNVRSTKVFQVAHKRMANGQVKTLTDPRDIYEMVANQGSRRLRACILGVIPGDVIEQAKRQCEVTMQNSIQVNAESIQKLTEAFAVFGVTEQMLSHRLGGKHLSAMIGAEMLQLRNIYRSIKDGMAKPSDFFKIEEQGGAASSMEEKLSAQKPKTNGKEQPVTGPMQPPFAQIAELINKAKSVDEIDEAVSFIAGLPADQQSELETLSETKKKELSK